MNAQLQKFLDAMPAARRARILKFAEGVDRPTKRALPRSTRQDLIHVVTPPPTTGPRALPDLHPPLPSQRTSCICCGARLYSRDGLAICRTCEAPLISTAVEQTLAEETRGRKLKALIKEQIAGRISAEQLRMKVQEINSK